MVPTSFDGNFIYVPPYLIIEINSQWFLEYHLINVYMIPLVVTTYFITGIFIDVPSYLLIESALRGATLASNYVFWPVIMNLCILI